MSAATTSEQEAEAAPYRGNPPPYIVGSAVIIRFVQSISKPATQQVRYEEQPVPNAGVPSVILVGINVTK